MIELWETELPPLWLHNAVPQAANCFVKKKSQPNAPHKVPIRLNDLTGPFLILGFGTDLALFIFLVEISMFKYRYPQNQRLYKGKGFATEDKLREELSEASTLSSISNLRLN